MSFEEKVTISHLMTAAVADAVAAVADAVACLIPKAHA